MSKCKQLSKMILDTVSASVVQDKKTPKECNVQRRQRSYDIQEVWRPDVIQLCERQKMPKMIECYDDSSMITFMSRCSLGRMKHVQICYLWIQEQLALKHFVMARVGTLLNMADVLTK